MDPAQSASLISAGFIVGLIVAIVCLAVAVCYLFRFEAQVELAQPPSSQQISAAQFLGYVFNTSASLAMARLAFVSCGIMVALAFGFLGFALFLIGVRSEMNVDASDSAHRLKLLKIAPGVFVLLCSTLLIGYCVSQHPSFDYDASGNLAQAMGAISTSNRAVATGRGSARSQNNGQPLGEPQTGRNGSAQPISAQDAELTRLKMRRRREAGRYSAFKRRTTVYRSPAVETTNGSPLVATKAGNQPARDSIVAFRQGGSHSGVLSLSNSPRATSSGSERVSVVTKVSPAVEKVVPTEHETVTIIPNDYLNLTWLDGKSYIQLRIGGQTYLAPVSSLRPVEGAPEAKTPGASNSGTSLAR